MNRTCLSIFVMTLLLISALLPGCGGSGSSAPSYLPGGSSDGSSGSAVQVTAVSPAQATSGTIITVTGTGFGISRDNQKSTVSFIDSTGQIASTSSCPFWSSTVIKVDLPLLAEGETYTVVVNVVTSSGTSSSSATPSSANTITVTAAADPPVLISIAEPSAMPGSTILLDGLNFGDTQGTSYVGFITADDEIIQDQAMSWNDNEIICVVPASITDETVDVYVHTDTGGDSETLELDMDETPDSGTVTGTVYEAGTTTPLSGVQVALDEFNAQTGSNGTYTLSGVPAGSGLTITACKDGYASCQGTINVSADSTTTADIYLTRSASSTGSVKGKVTSTTTGRPIAGARVTVQYLTAFSDETGSYQINGIAPGSGVVISASRKGYQDFASNIDITAGAVTEKNIAMASSTASVYGTVKGSDGAKLAGIKVMTGTYDTRTRQDGTYRIDEITVSGNETKAISAQDPRGHYQNYSGAVNVNIGTATQHDIVMQKADTTTGTLKGTVRNSSGKAIDGALITVTGTGTYKTCTDGGTYGISGIKPGTVSVKVEATGYEAQTKSADITASATTTLDFIMSMIRMVEIPGGTFTMGDITGYWTAQGSDYNNERPLTKVTLSTFCMDRYDITNSDYCAFLNSQGNLTEEGSPWLEFPCPGITGTGPYTVVAGYENRPVVKVSWYGAVAYCNWRSGQEGLDTCYGDYTADGSGRWGTDGANFKRANKGYRLPTNAEWEYACRAGSTTDYFWGENYDPGVAGSPLQMSRYVWWCGNCSDIQDVGKLLPNRYGLYDMNGNVWVWCSDYYYYAAYSGGTETDPTGPLSPVFMPLRVCRGGGYYGSFNFSRSSARTGNLNGGADAIGFRIVRTK